MACSIGFGGAVLPRPASSASAWSSPMSRARVLAEPETGPPEFGWRFARRALARWRSRATATAPCLSGLAVPGVPAAPAAVLAQRDAIRVVPLGLIGLVVPALALLASEGDGDP